MSTASERQPLADDIPLDRAWRAGRRVYVRCGYKSQLNGQLRDLGARWDGEAEALWTGSGKRTQVAELVRAAEARRAEIDRIKSGGRWVSVPRGAAELRARIKQELGGVFDGDRKQWAMPSDDALRRAEALIGEHRRSAASARAEQRRRRAAEAAEPLPDRIARLAAGAGRTLTTAPASTQEGTVTLTDRMYGRMRRASAEASAHSPGEVLRHGDGRRFLVIERALEFWNQDMVDDMAPHLADPHWCVTYTCAQVEPTAQETAEDQAARVEAADAAEIDDLMRQAGMVTGAAEAIGRPLPPGTDVAATITGRAGHNGLVDTGTLILTRDGVVEWRHPGYYDDYIPTAGTTSDPGFVDRVRRLAARGARTVRSRRGPMPATYTITVPADPSPTP